MLSKSKIALGALAALTLTALSAPQARAGHIFFSNVRANGIDLFSNPGHTFTTSLLTFTADVTGSTGDTLDFTFSQTGGTATTPANASLAYGSTPSSVSFSRTFDGTFLGSVLVNLPTSSPDYVRPDNQNQVDSFRFTFNVTPQSGVIPEPGTCALLASGLLPIAGAVIRRRRA